MEILLLLKLKEALLPAITELTRGGRDFHTDELALVLKALTGKEISVDSARHIANKLVLNKVLDRRKINPRLYVYSKRKGASLPASLTVKADSDN
jgi:predicted transcriptional regulator